jgi:beta-carotene 3-hydroxylase
LDGAVQGRAAMNFLINLGIVLGVTALMELVANLSHKYIMHGWGWAWHESHHVAHDEFLERNDLYAVVFGIPSMGLCIAGAYYGHWALWVGLGMTLYGFLYFFVHDGLVHNRWPWRVVPKGKYMTQLVQAHRMHHAVDGKDGCVSFGFLVASDVRTLKNELKRLHGGSLANNAERKAHDEKPVRS